MTYHVWKLTNRWNRRGERIEETASPIFTGSLKEAFQFAASARRPGETFAPLAIQYEVLDHLGNRKTLIDLYAETVGPETFATQDADPDFSINLDDWLQAA